ncbi:MAG TPA: nucleotidyl transferase AbiEii/AbiGii toxin family protein [Actinomycetota bacterium]|nr:nucleotidyl transferase AbiEii/AbiGii toxin family protein [Actinomycetota bacterium]
MTAYATPTALRTALEARLLRESGEKGVDLQRLRRRAVFERLLVRLDLVHPGEWMVKGGIALEVRMQERARSTRDLDLGIRQEETDGESLREKLIEALGVDPEGDNFTFAVGNPKAITADMGGRPGWRVPIRCSLAGREFANVRLDIVSRVGEISDTEKLPLPGVLSFAGFPTHEVEVVAREQHFAEKLHAMTRIYGDRPSSRVRDLADLILMIEEGFDDSLELRRTIDGVFGARATHPVPAEIPDPPESWRPTFADIASELDIGPKGLDEAMGDLRRFWLGVLKEAEPQE